MFSKIMTATLLVGALIRPANAAEGVIPIHHDIFITLKDKSPAKIERQIRLGKEFLTNHPGEVSFKATVLAKDLTRHQQVSYLHNDDEFDVSFHIVFDGQKAHDAYQFSERHVKHFIPDSNPNWLKVRVFDSEER